MDTAHWLIILLNNGVMGRWFPWIITQFVQVSSVKSFSNILWCRQVCCSKDPARHLDGGRATTQVSTVGNKDISHASSGLTLQAFCHLHGHICRSCWMIHSHPAGTQHCSLFFFFPVIGHYHLFSKVLDQSESTTWAMTWQAWNQWLRIPLSSPSFHHPVRLSGMLQAMRRVCWPSTSTEAVLCSRV